MLQSVGSQGVRHDLLIEQQQQKTGSFQWRGCRGGEVVCAGHSPMLKGHGRVAAQGGGDSQTGPPSHKARVSASIFCSPCKLSESGS